MPRTGIASTFKLVLLAGIFLAGCYSPFGIYHIVKKGDSLSCIARTYGVSVGDLKKSNYLRDPDNLRPGEKIFVPGAERPRRTAKYAAPVKSSPKKGAKKKWKGRKGQTLAARSLVGVPRGKLRFIWPLDGVLTSGFGMRRGKMHTGIDISAPVGTPIHATAGGRVIYSDNKQRGYGNLVIIQHEHGFYSVYAHNSVNLVHEGDRVRKRQVIAKVGSTGRSSGPHLHFEIRYKKKPVDPLGLLP